MGNRSQAKLPSGIDHMKAGYRARMSYEGRQYYLGVYPTLKDAKTALAVAIAQKAAQTFIPPAERRRLAAEARQRKEEHAITVVEWAQLWLEDLGKEGRSPGTISSYKSALEVHVFPAIGTLGLAAVTEENITRLIDSIKSKGGPWQNVVRTLRPMFRAAVDGKVGGLTDSPVKVKVPKSRRATTISAEEGVVTPEQVKELANLMPPRLALSVHLAAWCALRLGEILGLQRRDFIGLEDPQHATLRIQRQWNTKANPPTYTEPKAGSVRTEAIPPALVPLICDHLATHVVEEPTAPVFPSPLNQMRPVSQTSFDKTWRQAREKVRPGLRFHDLRHTGLTLYARQGATIQELMRRGGHKSLDVALRYQHADDARDRALTEKMNKLIGGEE